jgi:hypothetical protein
VLNDTTDDVATVKDDLHRTLACNRLRADSVCIDGGKHGDFHSDIIMHIRVTKSLQTRIQLTESRA